jgi:hypothetical protein
MPRKDIYHDLVRKALEADGWTITDDPFEVSSLIADLEVDLAAEKIIGASKGTTKIAVETKSFISKSWLHDFYKAVGQFGFYHLTIAEEEPERQLYLAMPDNAYKYLFKDPVSQKLAQNNHMRFITFNIETEKIVAWI